MITFQENTLTVEQYLYLRKQGNREYLTKEQAQKALNNSLYVLSCYIDNNLVGMGRLVGDGVVVCYVEDLIINQNEQFSDIGTMILDKLIKYTASIGISGTTIMLDLMCTKGNEPFYERHGFITRPTKDLGPAMIQYLDISQ